MGQISVCVLGWGKVVVIWYKTVDNVSNKSCHFISTVIADFSHRDQNPILIRKNATIIPIAYSSSPEFCPSEQVSNTHKGIERIVHGTYITLQYINTKPKKTKNHSPKITKEQIKVTHPTALYPFLVSHIFSFRETLSDNKIRITLLERIWTSLNTLKETMWKPTPFSTFSFFFLLQGISKTLSELNEGLSHSRFRTLDWHVGGTIQSERNTSHNN